MPLMCGPSLIVMTPQLRLRNDGGKCHNTAPGARGEQSKPAHNRSPALAAIGTRPVARDFGGIFMNNWRFLSVVILSEVVATLAVGRRMKTQL